MKLSAMSNLTLRDATIADAGALGALHVASWKETYTGIVPETMLARLSVCARTKMWAKILGDFRHSNTAAVIVVEYEGRVTGFGSCGMQRDEVLKNLGFSGEFTAVYVLRSHQGRGAGRLIMRAMAEKLAFQGHVAASLWVLRENKPARAFYERLGGVIVGEKLDKRPDASLVEHAYGWRELSSLTS
jgi:GNAT superfamily N-acetyltransferase